MSSQKFRIAILASGNGSNAEEIIKYFNNHPDIEVGMLLSNNPKAFAMERAARLGIPSTAFSKEAFKQADIFLPWLKNNGITHVVLAGFLWLIPDYLIKSYTDKIINIHPALLPKYGGKGMYGSRVHEAVRASADTETGITIHLVNENYDEGKILFQATCRVEEDYTPEKIAECVHKLEHEHYPKVIENWILQDKNAKAQKTKFK